PPTAPPAGTEGGAGDGRPVVRVGWLAPTLLDGQELALLEAVMEEAGGALEEQFPEFRWEHPLIRRPVYPPVGTLDPLALLELGAEEKLLRGLDLVLVYVPNELLPRERSFVAGVPSSALEVAALSSARFQDAPRPRRHLASLALHLLGHLLGLEHRPTGVMRPTSEAGLIEALAFDAQERERVRERLRAVADQRVEERGAVPWPVFLWRTLLADPGGLLRGILRRAPWRLPLQLGRYTAATAVTMIFLFLSAEAWELGAHLDGGWLAAGAVGVTLLATLALYLGQNLHQMARSATLREQLLRTQVMLFGTLLLAVVSLWATLFLVGLAAMAAFPEEVFRSWAGSEEISLVRYASFMATLGVVAGALGGNLEEEEEIKAVLLFDEET
ncbi:MAG: hypothetical protein D6809_03785, partial [Gammaproteobacteria bacterium]